MNTLRAAAHSHFVDGQRADQNVQGLVQRHKQIRAALRGSGRQLADGTIVRRARPLREAHGENLARGLWREQSQQADSFRCFGGGSGLQRLHEALGGIFAQPTHNLAEKLAIITKATVAKTIGHIMQRGLGHQRQDIDHAVGDLAAAQGLFHEFRHALLGANTGAQALCRAGALCFHTVERRERLLHRRVASLAGRFLTQAHEGGAHQRLQFRLALNSQLISQSADGVH